MNSVVLKASSTPSAAPRSGRCSPSPSASVWAPSAGAQSPGDGPGGPVLVLVDPADEFGRYYAEILRAEGLNEFAVADVGSLSAQGLAGYQVVVLARTAVTGAQAGVLDAWVRAGGNLIAMRPSAALAGTLGLGTDVGDLANGYLRVAAGRGVTGETMQFHGTADRWTLAGAATVATLYSNADHGDDQPGRDGARCRGRPGAAFTYDLARSVVYTRQGNPAWAGQERDGERRRSAPDDLFFGGRRQPDWVDLDKVAIPQADEQQRLLANLITQMNARPQAAAAVLVLPARREGGRGHDRRRPRQQRHRRPQFDIFKPPARRGCVVDDWECVRATSYVFPSTPMPDAQAAPTTGQGFEIGLHINTGCADFTPTSLREHYERPARAVRGATFPTLRAPATNRTHCIVWSDCASQARGRAATTASGSTRTTTTGRAPGSEPARHLHRLRHADALRRRPTAR